MTSEFDLWTTLNPNPRAQAGGFWLSSRTMQDEFFHNAKQRTKPTTRNKVVTCSRKVSTEGPGTGNCSMYVCFRVPIGFEQVSESNLKLVLFCDATDGSPCICCAVHSEKSSRKRVEQSLMINCTSCLLYNNLVVEGDQSHILFPKDRCSNLAWFKVLFYFAVYQLWVHLETLCCNLSFPLKGWNYLVGWLRPSSLSLPSR